MPTSYQSAVDSLFALGPELDRKQRRKFDLDHMRRLLAALGNPERRFLTVLIAGTNGKGSTSALLASIVRSAGYRVGIYTSPHLIDVNERIRVDGERIPDKTFVEIHARLEETANRLTTSGELPQHPSFFEMMTAMAFEYFAASRLDLAVLEVGMGGRLDATNVVEPLLSIVTDIALDHQEWLGNTIAEIAGEKAGIISLGGKVVLLPQHPDANRVLGEAVMSRDAKAISAVEFMPHQTPEILEGAAPIQTYPLEALGKRITVSSPLVGAHQVRNLALAVAAAVELRQSCGFQIEAEDIENGIRRVDWPGRCEVHPATSDSPEVLLDVAHNPAGVWALRSILSQRYGDKEITLVFGCMRDKPVQEMATLLFPMARRVILTKVESPRAAEPHEIAEAGEGTGAECLQTTNIEEALKLARKLTAPGGAVVVTGSVYIVGAALKLLRAGRGAA